MKGFVRSLLVCITVFAAACEPACDDEIRQSAPSPDHRYIARVFVENCHATAPFVTVVSIGRSTDEFDPDDYVFAAKGSIAAKVTWTSPNTLVIKTADTHFFRQKPRWRDVSVTYDVIRPMQ